MASSQSARNRAKYGDTAHDSWGPDDQPKRDAKKMFLVAGLAILSWVATYVGMLELIESNMGDLPLIQKVIIGFSVAMLMTMVVWLLDQMFAPISTFTRLVYAIGYLFLTIISVGFGFGFYWKVLESRSEASRSAEGAVGQVQGSLFAASTRLEQLQATLVSLTAISTKKAEVERAAGTSCPNSKPGDGPRRKLREDDAARFTFASDFVKGRVEAVNTEMTGLNADLAKITSDDKSIVDVRTGTRNDFMRALSRKLDMTVTGFNAFRTDPQLKQIRNDLAERSDRATFPDTKGTTFSCPDAQLATALKGVVRAIDELPVLEKPKIATVEGSEATVEAFRRLTATFVGLLSFKLPPSADELRDLQKKAIQSVESPTAASKVNLNDAVGLSKRDYVPLAIALFVDICLFLVSMGRPMNRLGGLVPKMRAAEHGPVNQILTRFADIHKNDEIREKFDVLHHVVFDYAGNYYVAVPLDAPHTRNVVREVPATPNASARAAKRNRFVTVEEAIPESERAFMRKEAQLIANLFSSFEKDAVFRRIDNRYLSKLTWSEPNVERARIRLRQQGSKFANANAFRIYKFNDGAWSEVILGAIMGAAKSVEEERRQRARDLGPELPVRAATMAAASAAPAARPTPARPQPAQRPDIDQAGAPAGPIAPAGPPRSWLRRPPTGGPGENNSAPHPASPAKVIEPQIASAHGPYARAAQSEIEMARYLRTVPTMIGVDLDERKRRRQLLEAAAKPNLTPAASGRPQANAPAATPHANNNTAPPVRRAYEDTLADAIDNVVPLPSVRPVDELIPDSRIIPMVEPVVPASAKVEPQVTYELRRETLTATVPASEAALPAAFLNGLRGHEPGAEIAAGSESASAPAPEQLGYALAPAPEQLGYALAPAPEQLGYALAPAPEQLGYALAPAPEQLGYALAPAPEQLGYALAPASEQREAIVPPPLPGQTVVGQGPGEWGPADDAITRRLTRQG